MMVRFLSKQVKVKAIDQNTCKQVSSSPQQVTQIFFERNSCFSKGYHVGGKQSGASPGSQGLHLLGELVDELEDIPGPSKLSY